MSDLLDRRVVRIDAGGHRARVLARRDELVEEHCDLARSIARHLHTQLPPCFDLDDLQQTAYLALIRVATRYRPREHAGTPFSAYARPAIRGAILDSVRRRHYEQATRPPLDAAPEPAAEDSIEAELDMRHRREVLADATAYLSDDQQMVLALYYSAEDARFEDIGRVMGISRTTASKIHASAIAALRLRGDQLRDVS